MDDTNDKRVPGFTEIKNYICESCSREACQWVLCVYFLVVILLCGGCGLWETFLLPTGVPNRLMACNTVALSVSAAACVDLLFSRKNRPLQALGLLVGVIVIVFHILSIYLKDVLWSSWLFAILAWLLAHFAWWVVNAHNPNLLDVDPQDSSGGSTNATLLGEGRFKGLKVD